MGFEFVAILSMVLAVVLVIGGFALFFRVQGGDHAELAEAWSAYASSRGLTFAPPAGAWPNRTLPRVSSADVTLEAIRVGEGLRTRLAWRPREIVLGRIVVTTEPEETDTLPRVDLVATEIDRALVTLASPTSLAERVLVPEVVRSLSGFRTGRWLRFEYERGRLALVWNDGERNPARLDEARRVLERAADELEAAYHEGARASG